MGVDLAWSPKRTTAVAVAEGDLRGSRLTRWREALRGAKEVADYVYDITKGQEALVAIDAPLRVPNRSGMRYCDRVVSAVFRSYRAGVHPVNRSNLSRYDGFQGEALASLLLEKGFEHAVPLRPRHPLKAMFETYPHAASIALFGLKERLPYKARGRSRPWVERSGALEEYREHLRRLRSMEPSLRVEDSVLRGDLDALKGQLRKSYEDLLDAILCAYVAYYYWFWGTSRCVVLGTVHEGYMVLPVDDRVRTRLAKALNSRKQDISE